MEIAKIWQKEYKKKDFFWGQKYWQGLEKILNYIKSGEALDIGAGEGRNSLFLAKNGFKVTAVDKIPEGLEKLNDLAKRHRLKITTKTTDVRKFKFSPNKYSLIISVATLSFLKKSEVEILIKKVKKSLINEGIFYFLDFSIKDPSYQKIKKLTPKPSEKNTFYLPKLKIYRHFFTKNEIKKICIDFKNVYLKEMSIKDTTHGRDHSHVVIEAIFKKIN